MELTKDNIQLLSTLLQGRTLFVAYTAGRPASQQAVEEAAPAREAGIRLDHYVGLFTSLRVTKKGDVVLTMFCFDRGTDGEGKYRCFNPSLGTLRQVDIIA